MNFEQMKRFGQINDLQQKLTNAWEQYWFRYSSLDSWQFWLLIVLLMLPLIVLYFRIDRKRALQLGFFGFSLHIWLSKFDELCIANGLWNYPYTTIPYLTASFVLDASFTPVAFMLVYQWTLNQKRNFYFYTAGLGLVLAFLFRPALSTFGLFSVNSIFNYSILFFGYVVIIIISKWTTNLFVYFQKQADISKQKTNSEDEKTVIKASIRKKKHLLGRLFSKAK